MTRKQISFEVTEDEHAKIKELAVQRRQSVKGMIFSALDKLIPNWKPKKEDNKNSPEWR